MSLPRPDDLGAARVWDLCVAGQAVRASLGLIPRSTVAFGAEVAGLEVTLHFQLRELTDNDAADIADIVSELEALVGNHDELVVGHRRGSSSAWWASTTC